MGEAVIVITGIAAACGVFLALAARYLHTPPDVKLEALTALLPGLNCGVCGGAGCADFAGMLLKNAAKPRACPVCDEKKRRGIARFLGIAAAGEGPSRNKVALVVCGGSDLVSQRRFTYNGIADCAAAHAVGGGDKACVYGCLGYATCALACPAHAIEMRDGVAVVDAGRCVCCGLCVATCPRKLIRMVPSELDAHVLCSSPEKGSVVRGVCARGCLGCRQCVKNAPGAFTMVGGGFLAARDYAQPPPENVLTVRGKCPGKCVQISRGEG